MHYKDLNWLKRSFCSHSFIPELLSIAFIILFLRPHNGLKSSSNPPNPQLWPLKGSSLLAKLHFRYCFYDDSFFSPKKASDSAIIIALLLNFFVVGILIRSDKKKSVETKSDNWCGSAWKWKETHDTWNCACLLNTKVK